MSTSASRVRRGTVAVLVAAAGLTGLSACGADTQDATASTSVHDEAYNPVNGINLDSTNVKVRNLYLLAAEGTELPRLRTTLVNTTGVDDALVGVTVGDTPVSGQLAGGTAGTVPVDGGTSVRIGSDGGPEITFPGLQARTGTWVPVRLLFRDGSAVAGSMLIVDAVAEYSDGTVPTGKPANRPEAETEGGHGTDEGGVVEQPGHAETDATPGETAEPAIVEPGHDTAG